MKLELKNIGKFKEAEVLLDGITVIGGENNTGKSTISKSLFSIIKAYQEAEEFNYIEERDFRNLLLELDKLLWSLVKYRGYPKDIYKNILNLIDKLNDDLRKLKYYDNDKPKELLLNIISSLKKLEKLYLQAYKKINKNIYKSFAKTLREIEGELEDIISKKEIGNLENSLNFQIRKNFRNQISNSDTNEISKITLNDGKKSIFEIEIKDNKCIKFYVKNEPKVKEISYIETPLVLNKIRLFDSLKYLSPRVQRKIYIPYIEEDIVKKLRIELNTDNLSAKEFLKDIEKIIGGKFEVEDEDIVFIEKGKRFYPINVASGIKSFGIIYLLIKNSWLVDDSHMLIFDEPEVHLHPKWQIRYAEMLVKLHKSIGCPVLLNTHSPYFIQAIRYFANKYNCLDKTHFYFAFEENNFAKLELIDNKLSIIFDSLIEPLEETPI